MANGGVNGRSNGQPSVCLAGILSNSNGDGTAAVNRRVSRSTYMSERRRRWRHSSSSPRDVASSLAGHVLCPWLTAPQSVETDLEPCRWRVERLGRAGSVKSMEGLVGHAGRICGASGSVGLGRAVIWRHSALVDLAQDSPYSLTSVWASPTYSFTAILIP